MPERPALTFPPSAPPVSTPLPDTSTAPVDRRPGSSPVCVATIQTRTAVKGDDGRTYYVNPGARVLVVERDTSAPIVRGSHRYKIMDHTPGHFGHLYLSAAELGACEGQV